MKGACLVLFGLHAALGVSLRDMMLASETNSTPFKVGRSDVDGDGHNESASLASLLNREPSEVLRSLLGPFAQHLKPPLVKLSRGAGVTSKEELDTVEDVIEALIAPAVNSERSGPLSLVLQLEGLGDALDASIFHPLLASILPLSNRTTAHLYISARDGSALENHTDVTEIVVWQLLGRKEWLHCHDATPSQQSLPFLDANEPNALAA